MSETPIADSIPDRPSDDAVDDRTPDQVAHDDAVPVTVDDQMDDAGDVPADEATFVAATDPADTAPADAVPAVDVPGTPVEPVQDSQPVSIPVNDATPTLSADNVPDTDGNELLALVRDTNDRIKSIQDVVSGFVADAKPFLDRIEKGGITALIGGLFGNR